MSDADRRPRARRTISGRNSARSSGLYDAISEHGYGQLQLGYAQQSPLGHQGQSYDSQRGLRPMDSRFSLNEHFALTKKEYEFGDDDALSVFGGRSVSMVSRSEVRVEDDAENLQVVAPDEPAGVEDDGEEDVEGGDADFYEVLCVPRGDLTTEEVRRAYFRWFELLYQPSREEDEARKYFEKVQEAFETLVDARRREEYDSSLGHRSLLRSAAAAGSDMGMRVEVLERKGVRPVDFMLGHGVSMLVPSFGRVAEEKIRLVQGLLSRTGKSKGIPSDKSWQGYTAVATPPPTVTVSGYTYGLAEGASPMNVVHQYHPLLHTLPAHKAQFLRNLCPVATVNFHQGFLARDPASDSVQSSAAMEVESDLLPAVTLTTRLSRSAIVHGSPTSAGVGITADRLSPRSPQLSLAATRVLGSGVAFARIDSGDWRVRSDETCRLFDEFSRLRRRLLLGGLGPRAASFEVGYTQGTPGKTVHRHEALAILRREKAVLDPTSSSWTVSLGGSADSIVSSLRYAVELFRTKLEVELCANSRTDHHVAVRNLFALGSSSSSLGLEVSLSPRALHLSFSFSRLNQRFSLPVYMLPSSRTLFLAAAVPVLVSAGLAFLRHKARPEPRKKKKGDSRREADALTFLLHRSLTREPDAAEDGITILSAKYGAVEDGWAGEDVADVTIALSALVRDGEVRIPAGLRTSNLPGFWDPAPGREKALRVRFKAGGREGVAEAKEGDGLRIPVGESGHRGGCSAFFD